jgi:hypothetical protein
MPTGACGVNCDVCQLNLLGKCSSCGPGRSDLAEKKIAAQQRLLGHPCAILACARLNHIDYCSRDCASFPCNNFSASNYPYGKPFLDMQHRRRHEGPPALDPSGRPVEIDSSLWDLLADKQVTQMANYTLTDIDSESGFLCFPFLNKTLLVDTKTHFMRIKDEEEWMPIQIPLLEIIVLDYFSRVHSLYPLKSEMISVEDLFDAHYFTGRSRLRKSPLLSRFGENPNGFANAGSLLGGKPEAMGDIAFKLLPFPRIPVYYILWTGNQEFPPRLSILFDRSIEKALSPPAIWCLVTVCNCISGIEHGVDHMNYTVGGQNVGDNNSGFPISALVEDNISIHYVNSHIVPVNHCYGLSVQGDSIGCQNLT